MDSSILDPDLNPSTMNLARLITDYYPIIYHLQPNCQTDCLGWPWHETGPYHDDPTLLETRPLHQCYLGMYLHYRRNNDVLAQSYGCKKIHFLALGMMDELVAGLRFEKRNIEIYVCKNLNCENFSILYDFKWACIVLVLCCILLAPNERGAPAKTWVNLKEG